MPPPAAILFDLDGTLVDSRADLAASINHMRREYGFPPLDVATVTTFVGNGMRRLIERAIEDTGIPLQDAIQSSRTYYFDHLLDATTLYPGVKDALEVLQSRGIALALVTNKPVTPAQAILAGLGVRELFGAVVGGDSCSTLKPHPAPLNKAVQELGFDPAADADRIWMAGDNYTDLEAAANAGFRSCLCRYGFGNPRDLAPNRTINAAADLVALADN